LVEVPAGVVLVSLLVLGPVVVVVPAAPLLPVVLLRPDEPPPAGVVALLSEPELEFAPLLALEFEPPEVELAPVFADEVPFDPLVVVTVCVAGAAALVVGTVSVGAPVVSSLPTPLPPQAASATATTAAAPPAMTARGKRLRVGSCMCLCGNPA
jgi:hypothetical protein